MKLKSHKLNIQAAVCEILISGLRWTFSFLGSLKQKCWSKCDSQKVYNVCNYTCECSFPCKDVVGFYADRSLWKCSLKLVNQTDAYILVAYKNNLIWQSSSIQLSFKPNSIGKLSMYRNTFLAKDRTTTFSLSQTPKTGICCLLWWHVLDGNVSRSCTAKTTVLREKPGYWPLFLVIFYV